MAFGVQGGAAIARLKTFVGEPAVGHSINPRVHRTVKFADSVVSDARVFPEIDCVRYLLGVDVLAAAEQRAAAIGVGADRVLITSGALSEETYLRALSKTLGVKFEPLEDIPRAQCPIDSERLIESAAVGLLPLTVDDDLCVVVAPRGIAARQILHLIETDPARARRFRFTSAERLNRFVLRYSSKTLAARASNRLKRKWPRLSAGPSRWRGKIFPVVIVGLFTFTSAFLAPTATILTFEVMLATIFLAWLGLRLTSVFVASTVRASSPALTNQALPVYTVMSALYREASSVNGLLSAIERLDYPPEKLDVIIAVEADDRETRAAIDARNCRMPITVIAVPSGGPRTKPKALNVALPFARGTFTVIYDAEDRPEPDQLRCALQAFGAGGDDLVCVQAKLCIDNTADSWLARLYTAEYAGQFDVFLPGLAAWQLPLPLGGSSNHFYTATLRELEGWDPYNVTEDADLGMRLARFGYRSEMISSSTFEEAPAHFGPWLRQRTRWFKGWIQTWLVHMRQPRRLMRELGVPGFIAFQLIVGGNVLAALVHPLFVTGLIYAVASGNPMWRGDGNSVPIFAALYGTTVVIGYLTSAFLAWLGLLRRGLRSFAWVLILIPVHWLLLSLAAWRALYQLAVAPYRWEKTEHGLAKSSRRAENLTRSLLELEQYLVTLKATGKLPVLANDTTYNAANRRPLPRAAA